MNKVGILTTNYPYGVGEQFLEQEILFWGEQTSLEVSLLPYNCKGSQRPVPAKVIINKDFSFSINYFYIFILIFQSFFWKELFYLISSKKISIVNLMRAVKFGLLIYTSFRKLKKNKSSCDLYYSYWSDFFSYGALLLKKHKSIKVLTRMHGYDLYENLYAKNYMPYKRQFINKYDAILLLSDSAKQYLVSSFNYDQNKIKIIPLGVFINKDSALNLTNKNTIKIVSVSNCIQVKRIDKIIDALCLINKKNPDVKIIWHHYGNGVLRDDLENQARQKLNTQYISYSFKGQVSNSVLQKNISENSYDLIINSSESEGIPVSLMEAMSKYVVPIAPNIGGIKHLVDRKNGYLISSAAKVEEISDAVLDYIYKQSDEQQLQKISAYHKVKESYNSQINYTNLIKIVERVLGVK